MLRPRENRLRLQKSRERQSAGMAGCFKNGPARGSHRQGPDVGSYFWPVMVTRADVADFMLKQVTNDKYLGLAPGLG